MIRQNYSPCLIDNTILYISFFESAEIGFIRSTISLLEKFFRINLFMIDIYGFSNSTCRFGATITTNSPFGVFFLNQIYVL